MCCVCDALFQSFICCVNWSIKSRPTLPYGTRKVFLRHRVISSYALIMVDELTVIIEPSALRPQMVIDGISTAT